MQKRSYLKIIICMVFSCLLSPVSIQASSNGDKELLRIIKPALDSSKDVSKGIKIYIRKMLVPIAVSNLIVKEVVMQNNTNISLEEIKEIDNVWRAAEDEISVIREKLNNNCARVLKNHIKGMQEILEAFVMDDKGALVCANNLTSDYWQGDEAKWLNSFNNRNGGIDIGALKFDKSANAVIQQISLPVLDSHRSVIGAITFGINTGKFQ